MMAHFKLWTCGFLFVILIENISEWWPNYHGYVTAMMPGPLTAPIFQSPIQPTIFQEELFVFVPGSSMDTNSTWKNRYKCNDFDVTTNVSGTTLELGIQLTQNSTITNALCYIVSVDWNFTEFNITNGGVVAYDVIAYNETCLGSNNSVTSAKIAGEISCNVTKYKNVVYSNTSMFTESKVFSIYLAECTQYDTSGSYLPSSSCPAEQPYSCSGNQLSMFSHYPDGEIITYVSNSLEIKAKMNDIDECGPTVKYTWRVLRMEPNHKPFTSFNQPMSSNIHFPAQTFEQGTYLVFLELETFGNSSGGLTAIFGYTMADANYTYDEAYIKVKVMLPELIAHINGASIVEYSYGDTVVADASSSNDPVTMVTNDTSDQLTLKWTVIGFDNSSISINDFTDCVLLSFPSCIIISDFDASFITDYQIRNHSNVLTLETNSTTNSMVMAIFTMSRGSRISSAVQGIILKTQAPELTLRCLYNCRTTRLNKITHDRLELAVSVDWRGQTEITDIEYEWSAALWNSSTGQSSVVTLQSENGLNSPRIHITKGSLTEGGTYAFIFNVTVTSAGVDSYTLRYVRTVNYKPYNGTCGISQLSGVATQDTFKITCSGWMDEADRLERDTDLDTHPILTYIVVQSTPGVAVENEILIVSSLGNMTIPVKEGNPAENYTTLLQVKVTDIYGDFDVVEFILESLPAVDKLSITADRNGSNIIRYLMAEVNSMIADIWNSAPDVVLAYASSIASQLQTIPIPVRTATVAKTLDSEPGVIMDMDMYEPLDDEATGFQEYMASSLNTTLDPATLEIQKAFELIAHYVSNVIVKRVVSGQKSTDQNYLTRVTQCLTNLIYVKEYTSTETKNLVVNGLAVLTRVSGTLWKIDADATSEKEAGENELVSMTSQTVTAVVPNELNQARLVYGMEDARQGLDDMIVITGGNISDVIDNAEMSPNERAYLYLKVQQQLQLEMEMSKPLAESSAHSILEVTRQILASTELCESCTKQVGTGNYFQTLVRDNATTLAGRPLSSGGTSVKLDSLADHGDQVIAASVIHFDKNIFMYDDDSASSQVAYGVIHIDIANHNVTHELVTYEQTVHNVEMEMITPTVFEEDVSKFSLHKFIYRSSNDDICIQLEPLDDSVAVYNAYIGKGYTPTILVHDIHVTVTAKTDWTVCIHASQMGEHTGMVHLGIKGAKHVQNNDTGTPGRKKRDVISNEYPSYYFSLVTVACMNWEENQKSWKTNKCTLKWLPKETKLKCECRNVHDLTFGNSFFLAPNTIEFSTVFLRFSPRDQAAVIVTLVVVFVLYALVIVWARRQDNKDIIRMYTQSQSILEFLNVTVVMSLWGVTPLADNFQSDDCYYIVKVHTGFRYGSGTDSRVAFILSGDKRDTGVRELYDDIRKRIPTGSVLQFLLSTSGHLGRLTHLRIWHDNRGEGDMASWYLSKVEIIDIQLNQSYIFICERWICVENSDESLECLLTVAGHQELQSLNYRFSNQAKNRVAEGHIWASIVYRPSFSNFTRVQRVTCAFMYVMVTMVANAMYYNPEVDYETTAEFKFGPFRFSLKQILVSVICAVITTPSTLLAVLIFQYSRRQVRDIDHYREPSHSGNAEQCSSCWPSGTHEDSQSMDDGQADDIDSSTGYYSRCDSLNVNTKSQLSVLSLDSEFDVSPAETVDINCLNKREIIETDSNRNEDVNSDKTQSEGRDSGDGLIGNERSVEMVAMHTEYNQRTGTLKTQCEGTEDLSFDTENTLNQTTEDTRTDEFQSIDITGTDIQSTFTQTDMTRLDFPRAPADGIIMQVGVADTKCQLPRWCSYIGWAIVWGGILASALMILLYSIEWGEQKSEEWLSTFCMSLLESAIVVDPVMILLFAFGMALVFKTIESPNAKDKYTTVVDKYEQTHDDMLGFGSFNNTIPKSPMKQDDLEQAKRKRDTEIRWKQTVVDLVINIGFLWVLLSISYSNRDDNSYYIHRAIGNRVMIINRNTTFKNVSSTAAFYRWVNYTAVPAIFPDQDINGDKIHWSIRDYISGFSNYRLGPPRLRQLRRKSEPCYIPKIETDQCYRQYTVFSEDTADYCVGWREPPCPLGEQLYNHSSAAWKYTSSDVTGFPIFGHVATYGAGGYVATLDVNLNISLEVIRELYSTVWVDRQTRAVALEFTVFNPNVNLFSYNMFMVEFPETGGAIPSFSIMPLRVYQHSGSLGGYIFACEMFSIGFLVVFLLQICTGFYTFKLKFHREFWFMFDCLRFLAGLAAVALYFVRLYSATVAIKAFNDNKRNFVDFHHIAFWHQLFITILAFLVFMSVVRLLKTLEGNKHIYIIARVFSLIASDLLWLGILLLYVFILFAVLGFCLFGSRLLYFMNMYKSVTTLFITLIGKNRFTEVNETDPIMAKLFFFIFSLSISLIMFSIFLSSMCGSIQEMTARTKAKCVDDVFVYGLSKFVRFCKGTPKSATRISNKVSPIPRNLSQSVSESERLVPNRVTPRRIYM